MLARVMLLPETVAPLTRPRCEWLEMRPGSTVLPESLMMMVLGGGLMAVLVAAWAPGWPAPSGCALIAVIFDPVMRMSACSIGGPPLPSMTRTSRRRMGGEWAPFAQQGAQVDATRPR